MKKVNADASMLDSKDHEHNAEDCTGKRRAGDLEGKSTGYTLERRKTDLTCVAQDWQFLSAIGNFPCPYAASYRCGQSFGTERLALGHGKMHLRAEGRCPCRYAIRCKCSQTWMDYYEARTHGETHSDSVRNCPWCQHMVEMPILVKLHQEVCEPLQAMTGDGREAKWEKLPLGMRNHIEWELEHAYYCQEAGEWKVK